MMSWVSKMPRLHDVGDAAIDNHAGVEDVGLAAFNLFGELHVGDDEAKIVLRSASNKLMQM